MSKQNESGKRDFVTQLIEIIELHKQRLIDKEFDPTNRIAQLTQELKNTDVAEAKQSDAMAASKNATQLANDTLDIAYKNDSATVDLITGLLGKKDNLVLEIKKLRK
jgi:hypothetical protein